MDDSLASQKRQVKLLSPNTLLRLASAKMHDSRAIWPDLGTHTTEHFYSFLHSTGAPCFIALEGYQHSKRVRIDNSRNEYMDYKLSCNGWISSLVYGALQLEFCCYSRTYRCQRQCSSCLTILLLSCFTIPPSVSILFIASCFSPASHQAE